MTERIDHAAEAKRLASLADNHYGAVEHRNGAIAVSESVEALMIATEAQVHATLALVEQQRIANLIAIWAYTDTADWALEAISKRLFDVANETIRPEVLGHE